MAVDENQVNEALSNLRYWIEGWKQGKGEYGGYVVHSIHGVENRNYYGPCPFQYLGIIECYLNLYKKCGIPEFLEKARDSVNYLCSLQETSGRFKHSLFEYNPEENGEFILIYNALATVSLLKAANFFIERGEEGKQYIDAAKRNIEWFLSKLWNGKYLTGCVNQDLSAVEAICWYYKLTGDAYYLDKFGLKIAKWALTQNIKSNDSRDGGFKRRIDFTHYLSPWYSSKELVSLLEIYDVTKDPTWLETACRLASFIRNNVDPSTGSLYHSWQIINDNWTLIKYPQPIASLGFVLYAFHRINKVLKEDKYQFEDILKYLLSNQNFNGAFPNSEGFNDHRDKSTIVGWNHLSLLFLSEYISPGIELVAPHRADISLSLAKDVSIVETDEGVCFYDQLGKRTAAIEKKATIPNYSEGVNPCPEIELLANRTGQVNIVLTERCSDKSIGIEGITENISINVHSNSNVENLKIFLKTTNDTTIDFEGGKIEWHPKWGYKIYELECKDLSENKIVHIKNKTNQGESCDLITASGLITDQSKFPVNNAIVEFIHESMVKHAGYTDLSGNFKVKIEPNKFKIIVLKKGYIPMIIDNKEIIDDYSLSFALNKKENRFLRKFISNVLTKAALISIRNRFSPAIHSVAFTRKIIKSIEKTQTQDFTPS